MKKRFLFAELSKYLRHKNALIITGMRQVGKTTLMRQLFDSLENERKLWFDLDNPLDQKTFEDVDYNNIYERLNKAAAGKGRLYVFIDEIQNFPEITKVIKYLIDHYQTKFVVTGSSNYYLKNLFPESLSGRKFLYQLPPLSFPEYLFFLNKLSLADATGLNLESALLKTDEFVYHRFLPFYNDYLKFGGFPEVVATADFSAKTQILKNIFASFFEKNLKILADYADIRELRDLILLLAPRVGSTLDVTKLGSELSLTRVKIYHYLEFLQGAFFLRLLPRYAKGVDRSVAGGKKVYFTDNGILNIVGQVNKSQLLENLVINQLAGYGEVSFYHKQNSAEIDAIVNKTLALEIKITATPQDLTKTQKLTNRLGIDKSFVISENYVTLPQVIYPLFF